MVQLAYYHNLTDSAFVGLSLVEKEKLYNVFVLHVQDSGELEVEGRITETDAELVTSDGLMTHTFGTFDDIKVELPHAGNGVGRSGSPN